MKLHRTVFTTMLALYSLTFTPQPTVAQDGWTSLLTPQLEKYHQPEVNAVHFFNRHIGWAVGGHANDRAGKMRRHSSSGPRMAA